MTDGFDNERKRHKRKLAETDVAAEKQGKSGPLSLVETDHEVVLSQIMHSISVLKSTLAGDKQDRYALKKALSQLSDCAKAEENVETVIREGAVDVIVPLFSWLETDTDELSNGREDIEKEACVILGLLATKPEHQGHIADKGALPGLVNLLKRYTPRNGTQPASVVTRRAADAITNLAHENVIIKNKVRYEGGIPPLVTLLQSPDQKVQRAAAGALRTLAFKNDENKGQIVECQALPTLIQMLRSEDTGIHYEAVGVIGNLVHSSQGIKRRVLDEGALQPVINLLGSKCTESQREAALLLGQFATTEPDYKAKIVQRGAVPPLVNMLTTGDLQLKEMAAFALGRLAQNSDNQAGIVQGGGLRPLLSLLDSKNGNLQHNAAFALYGLADNEDNIAEIIKEGGVQKLLDCDTIVQQSKDCVQKTLKRLEEKLKASPDKLQARVLTRILYTMQQTSDKLVKQRIATALARLATEGDLKQIFVERDGLETLLDMLVNSKKDPGSAKEAAGALFELAKKAKETAAVEHPLGPPTPPVYLGDKYVNNSTLSDVTFLVESKKFYAHRIALLASSDTFRAMFDGHYKEKEADVIPIPNISFRVFESMMRCIYTGTTEVTSDIAQELLQAADQYMLENLKRLCETAIGQELTPENLSDLYDIAEDFNAPMLMRRCVLFALEKYDTIMDVLKVKEFTQLLLRMLPRLRTTLTEQLSKCEFEEVAPQPAPPGQ